MTLSVVVAGCSNIHTFPFSLSSLPLRGETCKIDTYLNAGLRHYISSQYRSKKDFRAVILPFETQEQFAYHGPESDRVGWMLARKIQTQILGTGAIPIVEFYQYGNWPGKKNDFFNGNYIAQEFARNAGYDLLIVGYLEPIVHKDQLVLHTKAIDPATSVTLWNARATVSSYMQGINDSLARARLDTQQREMFYFPEKFEELTQCTTRSLTSEEEPETEN